jgi:acylphosphatase
VVLGGFTQKSGADLVANKAKSLGLDGKVIALKNGNYRVAAYGANETDARNAYDIARAKIEPKAWVSKY